MCGFSEGVYSDKATKFHRSATWMSSKCMATTLLLTDDDVNRYLHSRESEFRISQHVE